MKNAAACEMQGAGGPRRGVGVQAAALAIGRRRAWGPGLLKPPCQNSSTEKMGLQPPVCSKGLPLC